MKERIKKDSIVQEERRIEGQLQEDFIAALIEKNPFDVPEGMISNQLMYMKDDFSQRLRAQGMTLEMLGMNDETFAQSYRETAIKQIKAELLLDAIAKQEELKVEDEDLTKKMQEFADESNTPLEQIQKYFENEQAKVGLRTQLMRENVSAFVLGEAKITEVEPKQPESESNEADNTEEEES